MALAAAGVARADVFNMPAGQTSLRFVTVGDPGNQGDTVVMNNGNAIKDGTSGYGAVSYSYAMGTFDVTAAQYCQFLNAVAKTDTYGLYDPNMFTDGGHTDSNGYPVACGIIRSGSSGSYVYALATTASSTGGHSYPACTANLPVNWDSWGDAARFCNWLENGQPTGAEGSGTTETGSYTLNGAVTTAQLFLVTRDAGAKYFIPSENEWYKAAYYKGGSTNAGYWYYPTQASSTNPPSWTLSITGTNNANYNSSGSTTPASGSPAVGWGLTPVGYYAGSPSAYGTYDQGGDAYNFTDTAVTVSSANATTLAENPTGSGNPPFSTTLFVMRGGSFHHNVPDELAPNYRYGADPSYFGHGRTFRIAAVLPVWNGAGSGSSNWSTAGNWGGTAGNWTAGATITTSGSTTTGITSGGTVAVAPVEGLPVEFGTLASGGHATSNNDYAAGTVFSGITFASGAPSYTLTGYSITLAGSVVNQSSNNQVIALPIQLGPGGGTFDTGANTLTLSGSISGSGMALSKTGAGTLTLSASSNPYSGNTTVGAGTLRLAAASTNSISSSPALSVAAGATLDASGLTGGGISLASGQTLSGGGTVTGGVTAGSGGTLALAGSILPGSGSSVTVQSGGHLSPHLSSSTTGVLAIGSPSATSTLNLNGGAVLDFNVGSSAANDLYVNGNVNLSGTTTVNLTGLGGVVGGSYEIIHYTESLNGGTANLAVGTATGLGGCVPVFSTATPNSVFLNLVNPGLKLWTGAVNGTWDVNTTQNWTDYQGNPAYYLEGSPPDGAAFSDAALAAGNGNVTVQAAGVNPAYVNFTNASGTYTVGGGAIGGIATTLTKTGAGTVVLTGANTYGGGTSLGGGVLSISADNNLGAGALTFNGGTLLVTGGNAFSTSKAITLNAGGGTVWVNNSAGATLAGSITGSGGLAKAGIYPLTLTATSSYTGGTTVGSGTLALSGNGTIPSSSAIVVNPGGTFYLDNTATDNTGRTGTTAPVTVNGATFSYLGNASYSGTEKEQFGGLTLGPGQSTVTVSRGTGTTDHAEIIFGSNTSSLSADLVRTPMSGAMVNFTSTIQGQGGPGGTYTGGGITTAPGDYVAFGGAAGAGAPSVNDPSASIVVNGHAFARYSHSNGIHEETANSANNITNFAYELGAAGANSNVVITGTASATLCGSKTINDLMVQCGSSYANTLTGTLNIMNNGSGSGTPLDNNGGLLVSGSAAFTLNGGYTLSGGTITVGNSANEVNAELLVWIDSGTTTINSAIQDNGAIDGFGSTLLSKNGSGTLALTSTGNNYSYGTTLNAGVLSFANGALPFNSNSPNIWFYGGTLQWANGNTQDVSAGIAPIPGGVAAMIDTNGNAVTFGDDLSGGGGLVKLGAGTLTLAASNTYGGGTTISGGTLQLGDGSANNGSVPGNISNQSALVFANPSPQTYAGVISGSGGVTMMGPSTLTLTGSNSYGGGTSVTAGVLATENSAAIPSGLLLTIGSSGSVVLGASGYSELATFSGGSAAPLGAEPAGGAGGVNTVPEPGTLALLTAACGAALWGRRRRLRLRRRAGAAKDRP
jgi:autotransporter-associated beta strand protein